MSTQPTIFDLCREAGRQEYNTPGAFYMPELECSFLIRCLRRSSYDEGKGRLRRHLIIISPPDTVKSSLTSEFLKAYCGAVSLNNHGGEGDQRPTYLELQGGTTYEALRGGYAEGKFTHPMLHRVDFLYASEFFAFFGHTPNEMMNKIDQFNVALEEGVISFNQKTAKGATKAARDEFAKWCATQSPPITFDPVECTYEYHCGAMAIFCTRPFTAKQDSTVDSSGFLGRNAVVRWDPDDMEMYDYYNNQFGDPPEDIVSEIREFNTFAWRTKFEYVPAPPGDMVNGLVRAINAQYRTIGQRTGRSFYSIRPKRDRQNISQLLTAFCVARHIRELMMEDISNPSPIAPSLKYTYEDDAAVREHYRAIATIIEKRAHALGSDDPVAENALATLIKFIQERGYSTEVTVDRDLNIRGCDPYTSFKQPDFIKFFKEEGHGRQAAYRRILKLREGGHISMSDADGRSIIFRVADHIIEDAGFIPPRDIDEAVKTDDQFRRDFDSLLDQQSDDWDDSTLYIYPHQYNPDNRNDIVQLFAK